MMPGSSAGRLTVGALLESADVFGSHEPGPDVPVRVSVSVPVCLSFAELLGLLVFGSGSMLTEELDDESVIAEELQAALLMSNLWEIEANARRALDALYGRRGHDRETVAFTRAVAKAVTRVFGLPAPSPIPATVGRKGPWGDES